MDDFDAAPEAYIWAAAVTLAGLIIGPAAWGVLGYLFAMLLHH